MRFLPNSLSHIASMILRITYGYIPQEKDDPIIRLIEATNEGVSRSTAPGVFLVNHIPFCELIVGTLPVLRSDPTNI